MTRKQNEGMSYDQAMIILRSTAVNYQMYTNIYAYLKTPLIIQN